MTRLVIIHADESCLGNDRSRASPGGAGALVEEQSAEGILRSDFFLSLPATTNNQMALRGAIELLALLAADGAHPAIVYHSDSQYLVKGVTDWVYSWERNGWRRKRGVVENLELWKQLLPLSRGGTIRWEWVRGHAGHVKNEYADHLAVLAAQEQSSSGDLTTSGFDEWLAHAQSKSKFPEYDPDREFHRMARTYDTGS